MAQHTQHSDATLIGMYIEADAWQREITHPDYMGPTYQHLRDRAYARVLSITQQFTCATWLELYAVRRATK